MRGGEDTPARFRAFGPSGRRAGGRGGLWNHTASAHTAPAHDVMACTCRRTRACCPHQGTHRRLQAPTCTRASPSTRLHTWTRILTSAPSRTSMSTPAFPTPNKPAQTNRQQTHTNTNTNTDTHTGVVAAGAGGGRGADGGGAAAERAGGASGGPVPRPQVRAFVCACPCVFPGVGLRVSGCCWTGNSPVPAP